MISAVELNVLNKLVKSKPDGKFVKFDHYYKYIIIPSKTVEITMIDDMVIDGDWTIIVEFETDTKVDLLTINVHSGKYHKNGEVVGENMGECENCENSKVYFLTNNKVGKLVVNQKFCTENIYSYYGNQDGFNPCTINIEYNAHLYKNFEFNGNLSISTCKESQCPYTNNIYKLFICKR